MFDPAAALQQDAHVEFLQVFDLAGGNLNYQWTAVQTLCGSLPLGLHTARSNLQHGLAAEVLSVRIAVGRHHQLSQWSGDENR